MSQGWSITTPSRFAKDYFDDIPEMKLPKDMLELAEHILETKSGDLIQRKRAGMPVPTERIAAPAPNVVSLMDALKRSLATEEARTTEEPAAKAKKPKTVGEISPARVSRSDDAVKQGGARPAGSGSPRRAKCIVSKWIGPPYVSGRTRAWLKTKNPNFER